MYNLIISDIAEEELESIVNYTISTYGEQQGTIYLQLIFDAFVTIQKQPKIGHSRVDIPSGFSCYIAGQHCIIYSISTVKKRVQIVRVLHARMDFSKKF